jgi:hypothetical protein
MSSAAQKLLDTKKMLTELKNYLEQNQTSIFYSYCNIIDSASTCAIPFMQDFLTLRVSDLPSDILAKFDILDEIHNKCHGILHTGGPINAKHAEETFSELKQSLDRFNQLGYLLSYLVWKQNSQMQQSATELLQDVQLKRDELRGEIFKTQQQRSEWKEELENFQTKITKKIEESNLDRNIIAHADNFSKESSNHKKYALIWLIVTGVLLVIVSIASICFLVSTSDSSMNTEVSLMTSIRTILGRLFLLSIGFYATLWTSRMYRANQHLAVVNQHRSNALKTFKAFADAGDSPEIRNAVLLETTRCIFSPSVTGFLGMEDEGPSNRVVEVFQTALKTTKPDGH